MFTFPYNVFPKRSSLQRIFTGYEMGAEMRVGHHVHISVRYIAVRF
jgi:hypothetical protein